MQGGTLQSQPLVATASFNWVFLVELIVCGILAIFFLFYFNRVFATLVSYGLRAYTWHYYKVYVDVHALQVSPLGGRIFFKGFRYHGENETVLIQQGYMTWRYWLRAVQKSEYLCTLDAARDRDEHGGNVSPDTAGSDVEHDQLGVKVTSKKLPSRLEITLHGVEWFIYNRTAAYDSILEGFGHQKPATDANKVQPDDDQEAFRVSSIPDIVVGDEVPSNIAREPRLSRRSTSMLSILHKCSSIKGHLLTRRTSTRTDSTSGEPFKSPVSGQSVSDAQSSGRSRADAHATAPQSSFLRLLPIDISCTKGAIVMGNENTQAILSTSFDSAEGKLDATNAGPEDCYKMMIDLDFSHPIVQMRPNPDFKHLQITVANKMRLSNDFRLKEERKRRHHWFRRKFIKAYHNVRDLVPYFQRSVESFHLSSPDGAATPPNRIPGMTRWQGLQRYREDEVQDEHEGWQFVEYGRCSVLLDVPSLHANYYWDVAGKVTYSPSDRERRCQQPPVCPINGSSPPDWGLHLALRGGNINYGPWADRQRIGVQRVFFPAFYRDTEPAKPLSPGDTRQATTFRVTLDFEKETVLRIPTREPSKDWLWKDRADAVRRAAKKRKERHKKHPREKETDKGGQSADIRPYGWLSLYIDRNSSLTYTMGTAPLAEGTQSQLQLDLSGSRLMSSVNHGLLWSSGQQTVTCDLSTPLRWNAHRTWTFSIESTRLDLFLLRDHTYLITDLINDWGSGPSADFYTFVPTNYRINFSFKSVRVLLNVNDQNIIDSPTVVSENAFLIFNVRQLDIGLGIPLSNFKPAQNTIPLDFDLQDTTIELSTPMWNTYHTFLDDHCMAKLARLTASGGYTYHSGTAIGNMDTFELDITGVSPVFYLHGFLLRYFMLIKSNYFGDHVHFKTFEEFQAELQNPSSRPHPPTSNQRKSNDLAVNIHIAGKQPCVLIPTHIYDKKQCVALRGPAFDLDIRFTNYYMDFETTVGPLGFSLQGSSPLDEQQPQLMIDGLMVHAHRFFGPPPNEETYVSNWDFDVGDIEGECSSDFLRAAVSAGKMLAFTVDDEENALPSQATTVHHVVTFLRGTVQSLQIWVLVEQAAMLLSCDMIEIGQRDWIGPRFSNQMYLVIPNVTFAAVERKAFATPFVPPHLRGSRTHKSARSKNARTYAYFEASIDVTISTRQAHTPRERALQQEHIALCDLRTARAACLIRDDDSTANAARRYVQVQAFEAPSIPVPVLAEPLYHAPQAPGDRSDSEFSSRASSATSRGRRHTQPEDAHDQSVRSFTTSIGGRPVSRLSHDSDQDSFRDASSVRQSHPDRRASLLTAATVPLTKPYRASSWSKPTFPFHRVQPDTTDLPRLPQDPKAYHMDYGEPLEDPDNEHLTERDHLNQVFVMCTLPRGLRGFCSPETLTALASVATDFIPSTPIDVLEHLHADVMSDIGSYEKAIHKADSKTVFSYAVSLPVAHVRIKNSTMAPGGQRPDVYRDQYDIELAAVKGMFRQHKETRNEEAMSISTGYSVAVQAGFAALGAKSEQIDVMEKRGIFRLRLRQVTLQLTSKPFLQSSARINHFDTVSSSKTVGDVIALIERTTRMADSAIIPFQKVTLQQERRLRYLMYYLSTQGQDTPEPRFLTRPSYVLRAAGNHLRNHESWKVLARLRHIFSLISNTDKALTFDSLDSFKLTSSEARRAVVNNFRRWNALDSAQISKSHIMHVIFGGRRSRYEAATAIYPLNLRFFLGTFKFCLDPGPRETFLFFENIGVAVRVAFTHDHQFASDDLPTQDLVVQTYCSRAELTIRWEICELLEDILTNIQKFVPQAATTFEEGDEPGRAYHKHVHVLFATDRASVILDCINVVVLMIGNSVKGSLIEMTPASEMSNNLSVIVDGDTASVEFREREKRLMIWRLKSPRYYVSHTWEVTEAGRRAHDWKTSAGSEKVRYDQEEDPLGILHTINKLLEDEVRWIVNLMKLLDDMHQSKVLAKAGENDCDRTAAEAATDVYRFQVVSFLEHYEIHLALLPSIHLIVSGEVSRLSIAPGANPKKMTLDFDIKQQRHVFQSFINNKKDVITSVNIPPINGRVGLDMHQSERTEVDIDTTIELIDVDAGNVRNLLSIVRAPELTQLLTDMRGYVSVLQDKFHEIMPSTATVEPRSDEKAGPELAYWVRLTMAGIDVHSIAPGLHNAYVADMAFSSGMISAHMENSDTSGNILKHPEFHISILQLSLDLTKRQRGLVQSCGAVTIDAQIFGTSRPGAQGALVRTYHVLSQGFQVEVLSETASMAVDIAAYLQRAVETLDLSNELKRLRRMKLLTSSESSTPQVPLVEVTDADEELPKPLFNSAWSIDLRNICLAWVVSKSFRPQLDKQLQDLVFSIRRIELATREEDTARLKIADIQLQMVPPEQDYGVRSLDCILMPEMVFNAAYSTAGKRRYRYVLHAAGKALDIRLTSDMVFAAHLLQTSIITAKDKLQEAKTHWRAHAKEDGKKAVAALPKASPWAIVSVRLDAEFAGAVFNFQGRVDEDLPGIISPFRSGATTQKAGSSTNKYGPYVPDETTAEPTASVDCTSILRVPGLNLKAQYEDRDQVGPAVNAEILILSSVNTLYPPVVSIVNQVYSNIQEVLRTSAQEKKQAKVARADMNDNQLAPAQQQSEPPSKPTTTALGRCKLNVGLRMQRQEFTLSCQPIARVLASGAFDDCYVTVNTVDMEDGQHFLAMMLAMSGASIGVKHVYSNDSTASLAIESMVLSLMNSKHAGSDPGLSAILKVSPVKAVVDIRQVQDFLLFGEIWFPPTEKRPVSPKQSSGAHVQSPQSESTGSSGMKPPTERSPALSSTTQGQVVQKYHQVATQSSFPWNSVVSVESIDIKMDLGQTVGRSAIIAHNLWVSSKKSSDWEQHLCLGLSGVELLNKGRLDAEFILSKLRMHTSIKWPAGHGATTTPLIEASANIGKLCGKAAFEYQDFLVADITDLNFSMYNVRCKQAASSKDTLAATLEGDKVHIFLTTLTASRSLSLYQTLNRLVQGKREAYQQSVKEIERFIRRQSSRLFGDMSKSTSTANLDAADVTDPDESRMPLSLHTDVLVNLQVLHIGIFPNILFDHQIFKIDGLDFETQFAVSPLGEKLGSSLRLELGQLRVALSEIERTSDAPPKDVNVLISGLKERSQNAKGGIILKVPQVVATMSTWQVLETNTIEYIFHSQFQGKVDVGWNYSRISVIRNMWAVHTRALAAILGKPLRQSAVQITSERLNGPDTPEGQAAGGTGGAAAGVSPDHGREKITAVVNVPTTKYRYVALRPPVVDTPQLREMGEATPPLEWIGLNREKLPNVVHQLIIVALTEVATDVEDAYFRILGSSTT